MSNHHLSKSQLKQLAAKALPHADRFVAGKHIADCSMCRLSLAEELKRLRSAEPIPFILAPQFWMRHDHVGYERLVGLAERTLEPTKEVIEGHLSICDICAEDVRIFMAFREHLLTDLDTSSVTAPLKLPSRWALRSWLADTSSNPGYGTIAVILGVTLVCIEFVVPRRTSNIPQVQPTPQISSTPTLERQAAKISPTSNVWTTERPKIGEPFIRFNDRNGVITLDKKGNVTGLDAISESTRNEIAHVLLSERIDRPQILEELKGEDSALKGNDHHQPFKLIAPARSVISSNRPTFKWEKVPGVTSYRVRVANNRGQVLMTSDTLTPDRTEWRIPTPLKRGEIYSWTVTAIVDGNEIVAPGPLTLGMNFQVLSAARLQQLALVRKTRSHLALGIFYAKVGIVTKAQQEFEKLMHLNPNSRVAVKLFSNVR